MERTGEIAVRRATGDELSVAAETLARAFGHDPAWAHLLPDVASRPERLLAFFRAELAHLPPGHHVWLTEDRCGAAVWAEPGRWRAPLRTIALEGPAMLRVFGRRLGLAARAQARVRGFIRGPRATGTCTTWGSCPKGRGADSEAG
jgi:hypothetical protein